MELQEMDLGRFLMIDLQGSSLSPDERAFLLEHRPGGVCLFGRNVVDRFQVADYVAELRTLAGDGLLVAIDQEGGGVVRIRDVPIPPAAMALGAADDVELTRAVAAATARGLAALGINVDFAPVADVNANPANPVIADRSFGADATRVAHHVRAFVQGLQQAGVAATLKHFPGHGDTAVDSHLDLPTLPFDAAALDARELVPFRAGIAAGAAAVMSAHILVPALDPEHPATMSRSILRALLRERLGFDGVVFSDALNMRAIADRYGAAEATLRAFQAGVDMPVQVGSIAQHAAVLAALRQALRAGQLDRASMSRSAERLATLARSYPGRSHAGDAWQADDDALLDEAARRGLVLLGQLPPLRAGARLVVVAADEVRAAAASQSHARPALRMIEALEVAGLSVMHFGYALRSEAKDRGGGRENDGNARAAAVTETDTLAPDAVPRGAQPPGTLPPGAQPPGTLPPEWKRLLEDVRSASEHADATLFLSTARTPMTPSEIALGRAVARAAPRFVHVALWNPYHVAVLPGPALIGFGFADRTAKALVRVLLGADITGRSPVPLRPSPD